VSLGQEQPVVPPVETDKFLRDFSAVIQRNMGVLFQAAHYHINSSGLLTANPKPTDGNPGDILLGVIGTDFYLFAKVNRTQWIRFGPGTAL
jgi:hypothetical protein